MIDRTLLTEALEWFDDPAGMPDANPLSVLAEAARLLLDFPTDEQVEAAMEMIPGIPRGEIVDALEAVRDTMIGDEA